jgi:glycosyltransferase involved in cell wall biosynthesis
MLNVMRSLGNAVGETLLVPLAGRSGHSMDVVRRLLGSNEPVVFPLAQLANGGRRILRERPYDRLALAGAPPTDELGYGFATLIALLGRPKHVSLVDLDREEVVSTPLLRYIFQSAPFALGQLAASALLISAQQAAIPLARRTAHATALRPELTKLVYLLPAVGATSSVGGSVTHTHEVIRALTQEGVEVEAITTSAAIAKTAMREQEPPCAWRVVRTPRIAKAIAASAAAGGDAAIVWAALDAARGADAIYQRHARFSLAGALLARLSGKPLILEYNGSEDFAARHWNVKTPLSSRIKVCEDAALAAAARIIVVSEVDRRSLLERGVEPKRIVMNPNGVDAQRFAVGGGAEMRRRHGIDNDRLLIGFVGSFGPWHGAPVLASAFVDLATRVPAAHLLLVGDGRELEATMEILRDGGVERRTTTTGQVAPGDIPAYLDACDILVAPHVPLPGGVEFFGSPTKLFEYMAAGKAIVASRLGQIGDVLKHDVTAWMVEPGDTDGLRDGLLGLSDAPLIRRELGANARRQVIEHHSWRLNARRVMDAWATLAREAC